MLLQQDATPRSPSLRVAMAIAALPECHRARSKCTAQFIDAGLP
jgi:hypothetical protein